MALVNLKDVSVTRLNNSGGGFGVLEQSESKGKTYKTYWTVWGDGSTPVQVGDIISVSGFLSSKVGDPKTGTDGVERRYVELSINSPRITSEGQGAPQGQQDTRTAPSAPPADSWAPALPEDSLPF